MGHKFGMGSTDFDKNWQVHGQMFWKYFEKLSKLIKFQGLEVWIFLKHVLGNRII
jgi:hypothetical protein